MQQGRSLEYTSTYSNTTKIECNALEARSRNRYFSPNIEQKYGFPTNCLSVRDKQISIEPWIRRFPQQKGVKTEGQQTRWTKTIFKKTKNNIDSKEKV